MSTAFASLEHGELASASSARGAACWPSDSVVDGSVDEGRAGPVGCDAALDPRIVDRRIAERVAVQAPVRVALAKLCGRLQATKAFERLGFARLGDYTAERLGVSARQVHEFARMDRAFQQLPPLETAFAQGRIGWAKARDIARVATKDDVADWLAAAAVMNSDQLAREVRAVDQRAHACAGSGLGPGEEGGESGEDGACVAGGSETRREAVRLRIFRRGRARLYPVMEFARGVCGQRVSLADALDAVAAEFVSAVPFDEAAPDPDEEELQSAALSRPGATPRGSSRSRAGEVPTHPPPEGRVRPRSLPRFLRQILKGEILEGLEDADPFQLDERLRRLLRFEQRFEAELAPLLAAVAARCAYRQLGFSSMAAYASDRTGASSRKTKMLLRLQRACERCPPLHRAFRSGELSWVQAYTLVPIAVLDHSLPLQRAWIRRAQQVSVRRLEQDVGLALSAEASGLQQALDPEREEREAPGEREQQQGSQAEGQTRARATRLQKTPRTSLLVFTAPSDQARFFRAVLANTQRRIEQLENRRSSEAEAFDVMVDHFLSVHSDAHRERVRKKGARAYRIFERDGWRCSFPGCSSYRHLEAHHIQFRSAGGSDRDDNLTVLCKFHHLRGVHAGMVSVRGRAPNRLHFALGLRSGSPPLREYTSGDRVVAS